MIALVEYISNLTKTEVRLYQRELGQIWTRDILGRDIRKVAKRRDERPSIDSAPGVFFGRIRENSVVILEDDETEELDEASSDLISAKSEDQSNKHKASTCSISS